MTEASSTILPGATIGVMGGGQLGRMLGLKVRELGYRFHVLDPQPDCPASHVADRQFVAGYDDLEQVKAFAASCDVVTFEFENVPADSLQAIAHQVPVHPAPQVLFTCRHRIEEKQFLQSHQIPTAPFHACQSLEDVTAGIEKVGLPCILKTAEFGYDGKGQVKINAADEAAAAWEAVKGVPCVLEGFVPFDGEVSVIVARSSKGQVKVYPAVWNEHANHILDLTLAPAPISPALAQEAETLACKIAEAFELVGVLAVEMFVVGEQLIINELAPRPHNSGHWTIDAAMTCQFEQQLRAITGLPLGDVSVLRPAVMANLMGDLWFDENDQPRTPQWDNALQHEGTRLHLYGKQEARKARKMGHLTALAETLEEAKSKAIAARQSL